MDDNTLVVAISDHGVLLGEYGWVGKRYKEMHQPLCHVPFVMTPPAGKAKGRASRYFASTHDVGPTILGALGFDRPDSMNGQDLSVLLDGKQPRKRTLPHRLLQRPRECQRRPLAADLGQPGSPQAALRPKNDPGERRNVAARHPEIVKRLWGYIKKDAGGRRLPRFKDPAAGG